LGVRDISVAEPKYQPRVDSFDVVAKEYDARFTNSAIGRAQRDSVWLEMDRVFRPGQRILEINCGTGVDALHLAAAGIQVLACDASGEMIRVARRRLGASTVADQVEFRILATELICHLDDGERYDGVLSNFAG
jgi:ubiquinone/menaquinone biosynthesis C-methylase UbiE